MPTVAQIAPGALIEGAPSTSAPLGKKQKTERDRVVPFAEFGGLMVNIWEVKREICGPDSTLRPLIYNTKTTTRAREIL